MLSRGMGSVRDKLPYRPEDIRRELAPFYIGASDDDIYQMLRTVGADSLDALFDHLPEQARFASPPDLGKALDYDQLILHLEGLAQKNRPRSSFLGHALKSYKVPDLIAAVSAIRGLSTAYTPYQPERSQGTLWSLWMYSSCLSMLTGFEALNASLYDRASCLFEACRSAQRLVRGSSIVLVSEGIHPQDLEVLRTHARHTNLAILPVPLNPASGLTDIRALERILDQHAGEVAALAFMQVNCLGLVEDSRALADICPRRGIRSIVLFDPIHLATDGLAAPADFGADMIVGEGQHLASGPNFGGPGLGIFGIRHHERQKNAIRTSAGRYVGRALDAHGQEALCMVLSTREQHIRRERATSNICSNQSFMATLAGAGILARGEEGMRRADQAGVHAAIKYAPLLTAYREVRLAFPDTPAYNELCLELDFPAAGFIRRAAREFDLHLGVDISHQFPSRNLLLISFSDIHSAADFAKLEDFFASTCGADPASAQQLPPIPGDRLRGKPVGLPNFGHQELVDFYQELGRQNVSPDDNIYPLGSCTMKYNPHINDWAANLPGFTDLHPQAPLEDAQGCLEILYQIQELFKGITGLAGVSTQPVAGAQGELAGLKMFQAYHQDRGEDRCIVLIPQSAHGTNPASAAMAGGMSIVAVKAGEGAEIDFEHFCSLVKEHGKRLVGLMVTNPNTSGIFERRLKEMSDLVHQAGGLVYMDGANMNAIAGRVDLAALGVDAVHNNLHKTWTIPHGGGGPGDAIVAVSEKLLDYLPGQQVIKTERGYTLARPAKSIGSFHRHFGNFAHKVRCYSYLRALAGEGVAKISGVAVLSAQYLHHRLKGSFPTLPAGADRVPRMHEFILGLDESVFESISRTGIARAQIIARVGKLFLDFGLHAPTVAFPEVYGLMVEPTESFDKAELDRFVSICQAIADILRRHPYVLYTTPHFTPVGKIDEVAANKELRLWEVIKELPVVPPNRIDPARLGQMEVDEIVAAILEASASPKS